ncbi:MAG: GNAT family N-acetyltransferase [Chloroflexi bacterium]|nr:GNAT family N-acetyltransferase [Chloroflexota bacterium]
MIKLDPAGYRLVTLQEDMLPAFMELLRDYTSEQASRYGRDLELAQADFAGYVKHLEEQAAGVNLPRGYVPSNTYWLQNAAGDLLGGIRLRPLLSPLLAHEAGHIGYDIRPSKRGQGYGTLQLTLLLPYAREMGLDHVLITCKRENIASARVIEKNGGEFENEVLSWVKPNTWFRRYWIRLS